MGADFRPDHAPSKPIRRLEAGGSGAGAGRWPTWTQPDTGMPIRQQPVACVEFDNQLVLEAFISEFAGLGETFLMAGRWILKVELQPLLAWPASAVGSFLERPIEAPGMGATRMQTATG